MMDSRRLSYIDIAKGISIICIVLGHLNISRINHIVFTFHVPIFFLISGYFLHPNTEWDLFLKKKLRTLVIPYCVTCLAIIVLDGIGNAIIMDVETAKTVMWRWTAASLYGLGFTIDKPFEVQQIGALWFLWATFWSSIILRWLLTKKPLFRIFSVLLLFLFGTQSGKLFWLPLSIQPGCCALLFMYLGSLWRQNQAAAKAYLNTETKAAAILFAIIIWIFFIRDFQSFWLVRCDVGRGAVDIFGCLCACGVVLFVSSFIDRHFSRTASLLSFLGRYSLIVLCVHITELNIFPWGLFETAMTVRGLSPSGIFAIQILIKTLIILPLTILLSRWNLSRKVFGFSRLSPGDDP